MSIAPQSKSWLTEDLKDTKTEGSLVGKDVQGYCGSCKDNRLHTVISATETGEPDKVQCNSCGSQRKFKAPKTEKVAATKKKKAKKATKSTSKAKTVKSEITLPLSMQSASSEDVAMYEHKQSALEASNVEVQTYSMQNSYQAGHVIRHKKFGTGFVLAEIGKSKVEVLFEEGRKLLVSAPKVPLEEQEEAAAEEQ